MENKKEKQNLITSWFFGKNTDEKKEKTDLDLIYCFDKNADCAGFKRG